MGLISGIGRAIGNHPKSIAAAAGIGTVMAMSSNQLSEGAMELAFGVPDMDNYIMGTDVSMSPFSWYNWPGPKGLPMLTHFTNKTMIGNVAADNNNQNYGGREGTDRWTRQAAVQNVENGYSRNASWNSNYPTRSTGNPGLNATGDMVFGMHNSRVG